MGRREPTHLQWVGLPTSTRLKQRQTRTRPVQGSKSRANVDDGPSGMPRADVPQRWGHDAPYTADGAHPRTRCGCSASDPDWITAPSHEVRAPVRHAPIVDHLVACVPGDIGLCRPRAGPGHSEDACGPGRRRIWRSHRQSGHAGCVARTVHPRWASALASHTARCGTVGRTRRTPVPRTGTSARLPKPPVLGLCLRTAYLGLGGERL